MRRTSSSLWHLASETCTERWMPTSWRSCSVWRKSRSCAGRNGGRFHRFVSARWFALTLKQSLAGCSNKGSSLCPLRRGHGDPPRRIRWLRGSWTPLKGKKILVAGACNHPNVPSVPFSFELHPNHVKQVQYSLEHSFGTGKP